MQSDNPTFEYIQREFYSPQKLYAPIHEGFKNIFSQQAHAHESQFHVPAALGNGGSKRIKLGSSIEICFNEMQLYQDLQLSGKTQGDSYILMFCLGDNVIWQETNSGQALQLEKNCGILYHSNDIQETGVYEMNRHYQSITISLDSQKFDEYFSSNVQKKSMFTNRYSNYESVKYLLSSEARIIIAEVLHCTYTGAVKKLYLESKALELLAVCVNTIMQKDCDRGKLIKLSPSDMDSLAQAKELLDNNLSSCVTIASLARSVCLNESKLKSGFKHVYGKPVYTYLLDKRMETARIFLETRHTSVAQVADFVGYESGSSFSKAFHKKFGFYPSECALSTKFKKTDRTT